MISSWSGWIWISIFLWLFGSFEFLPLERNTGKQLFIHPGHIYTFHPSDCGVFFLTISYCYLLFLNSCFFVLVACCCFVYCDVLSKCFPFFDVFRFCLIFSSSVFFLFLRGALIYKSWDWVRPPSLGQIPNFHRNFFWMLPLYDHMIIWSYDLQFYF